MQKASLAGSKSAKLVGTRQGFRVGRGAKVFPAPELCLRKSHKAFPGERLAITHEIF